MSVLPIFLDRDDRKEPWRRELLALYEMRRGLERRAARDAWRTPVALNRAQLVRELRELIEALDRRLPQVERAREAFIARDAAALKLKALKRLAELSGDGADDRATSNV